MNDSAPKAEGVTTAGGAGFMPEIAYTETQFGIRVKGTVRSIAIGPNEAERYRAANVDIHSRQRTVYRDRVTDWEPLTVVCDQCEDDQKQCLAFACDEQQGGRHTGWWCDWGCCSRSHAIDYYGEEVIDE